MENQGKDWQDLLDFVAGKVIVGLAVSDDGTDFDLIFEDGSRLELYALEDEDEAGNPFPFIGWALMESEEGDEIPGNGREGR